MVEFIQFWLARFTISTACTHVALKREQMTSTGLSIHVLGITGSLHSCHLWLQQGHMHQTQAIRVSCYTSIWPLITATGTASLTSLDSSLHFILPASLLFSIVGCVPLNMSHSAMTLSSHCQNEATQPQKISVMVDFYARGKPLALVTVMYGGCGQGGTWYNLESSTLQFYCQIPNSDAW